MPAPAVKKHSSTKTPARKGRTATLDDTGDLEEWKKAKQLLKPKDQLEISDADLKEVLARVLVTTNPQKPTNLVQFSYKEGQFIEIAMPSNLVVGFRMKGTQIHIDSDEAYQQLLEMGEDPEEYRNQVRESAAAEEVIDEQPLEPEPEEKKDDEKPEEEEKPDDDQSKAEADEEEEEKKEPEKEEEPEGEGEEEEGEAVEQKAQPQQAKGKKRKLTNQFNFCERAALTYNNPVRNQEIQTVPPPRATFSGHVLQWVIYDAYQKDYEAQELEKELEKERKEKEKTLLVRMKPVKKKAGKAQMSEAVKLRVAEAWKVLERMINQNTFYDIAKDFRYWEDPSDEFRDEEGTLLPLWKFTYDKVRKNTVTDIEWNPYYYDMFAVTFGYLDFAKPIKEGAVCVYTLKNPSFPDYICITSCSAMCVSTHPKFPYMLAVGLIDGTLLVYNIQATCKEPAFRSSNKKNKHQGIVWQVQWGPDLPDGELNFFSVSSDGNINQWILMQTDLSMTIIFKLYLPMDPVPGPDGVYMKMKGSVCSIVFHPTDPNIYLAGTETGYIYKCSTAYSSINLFTYEAHHMPTYKIDYNKFNSDIFITCSSDWRIKIWEDRRSEPLFVFDMGASVGDVQWAPYSSTVFAAVTTTGKVFVFDINVNKYKPICEQAVVSKRRNKLTRLAFNDKLPIIIVGDDKGCVTTLKLSPNLRVMCKPPKKQQHLDQYTLQCMKLEKLLALVREPLVLTPPPDTAGLED